MRVAQGNATLDHQRPTLTYQTFTKLGLSGTILNMTSILSLSPSPKYFATHAYATAKSAIIGLTKSTASYYASRNIRINAVAPSLIDTPMSQRAKGNEEIMNFIKNKQPLDGGRIGLPTDLNGAAIFLMSDAAKFITGQKGCLLIAKRHLT